MKRKLFTFLLACCMLASLLAGCSTSPTTTGTTKAGTTAPVKQTKIVFMHMFGKEAIQTFFNETIAAPATSTRL